MRNRISLDTLTNITDFCNAVSKLDVDVYLVDSHHKYKVNAKSQLSCILAGAEWRDIWVECEQDIYQAIKPWIIEGTSMT